MKPIGLALRIIAMIVLTILAINYFADLLLPDGPETFAFMRTCIYAVDIVYGVYLAVTMVIDRLFQDKDN